jgi:hypothetical protein
MTDSSELREIQKRIQVIEDNLRQLQEQATALSGAADEERIASRIADQEATAAESQVRMVELAPERISCLFETGSRAALVFEQRTTISII